jgi:hypothetical protein
VNRGLRAYESAVAEASVVVRRHPSGRLAAGHAAVGHSTDPGIRATDSSAESDPLPFPPIESSREEQNPETARNLFSDFGFVHFHSLAIWNPHSCRKQDGHDRRRRDAYEEKPRFRSSTTCVIPGDVMGWCLLFGRVGMGRRKASWLLRMAARSSGGVRIGGGTRCSGDPRDT